MKIFLIEVDIDKAQAEEDANYFDEEDLGNFKKFKNQDQHIGKL